MFSQAMFKIVFTFVVVALVHHGSPAFANEEKAAEKKEEKKEEGGEKKEGAQGGEGDVTESQKKQMNEAAELQARVSALQAKVKSKEESISKLIEEKNHEKNPEKVKEIIAEMVTEHKEMTKLIEEYEQNRSLLRYRYPEKGYKGVRSYERMEVKPLEQMENQMSVESKLKRNMKTVHTQYGVNEDKEFKAKRKSKQKGDEAPSLTEPIVIQK
jgi:hypothetical protein